MKVSERCVRRVDWSQCGPTRRNEDCERMDTINDRAHEVVLFFQVRKPDRLW